MPRAMPAVCRAAALLLAVNAGAQDQPASPTPAPMAAPRVSPPDQRALLAEILRELQGLRGDIRTLVSRDAAAPRPQQPAPPVPSSIDLGLGMTLGSDKARVALIELSEFQCPFCKRHHDETFPGLKQEYVDSGKIRYEFRHYPLAMHAHARSAAVASSCAARLGAFWPAHDALFKNQSRLGTELYEELPRVLGVDPASFKGCLADPQADGAVGKAIAAAEALGVRSTPHFFIGRVEGSRLVDVQALRGAQPLGNFRQALDALLATAK